MTSRKYRPLPELLRFRLRSFYREPEAVFWTYGFPILLTVLLGIAFRNRPPERIIVDIEAGPGAEAVRGALAAGSADGAFDVLINEAEVCRERLRLGKCAIVVSPATSEAPPAYHYDPTQPASAYARVRVDDALQRSAGRADPLAVRDAPVTEPGSRYIDFLIPGLLGMNLMGGGMWGIGYVTVDLRVRKLLKRLVATPMPRGHFLLSMVGGRMAFVVPEIVVILLAGVLLFGFPIRGGWVSIFVVAFCGAVCFAGVGLLVACRAERLETVAGLLNVVMMPMWLLSGLFFSTSHFPDVLQPLVQALPLTQLLNALRAVILEGGSVTSQTVPLLYLLALGGVCFCLALRWFRWT
ncbi:MAG TPA: ABC transporter permease [Phycisphaerae bacterium]|nr:ABC transporter permease [Phycisphaerae bacterium]HNU43892.1 ABC transporter permease [Phycisphaerae bacterium]